MILIGFFITNNHGYPGQVREQFDLAFSELDSEREGQLYKIRRDPATEEIIISLEYTKHGS